jgi:hypothetical protein
VTSVNAQATAKEGEVSKVTKEVTGVIAGKDEQLNWLVLNKWINAQLPQPDGSNLKEHPRQTQYWANPKAAEALREYQDRVRGGQKADQPMPDDIRENLVLMDVEAISSLYTENLKMAFDNAQRAMTKYSGVSSFLDAGMCKYDVENPPREAPPEGAGWVIEIRGSTYQKDGRQFFLDTLVRNLTVNGRSKLPLEPTGGAPSAAPTAAPAEGQPAPARRPEDEEAMINAIIKDRVRYVFLLTYATDKDPKPGAFKVIGQSYLRDVVSPAGPATGPGAPAVTPGAAAPQSGRDTWTPLTAEGGGSPASSGPGPSNSRSEVIRPGAPPRNAPGGVPITIGAVPAAAKEGKPRYEFVVMFFWQEPTPSDSLMNLTTAQPAAAGGQGR